MGAPQKYLHLKNFELINISLYYIYTFILMEKSILSFDIEKYVCCVKTVKCVGLHTTATTDSNDNTCLLTGLESCNCI